MTNENQIRQALRSFILTNFLPGEDPQTLEDSTALITSGVIASLSMLELATFIEEEFGITLLPPDLGVEHMDSIDLLVQLIVRRGGRARHPGSAE
jgi:acyl carrier protein